MEIFSALLAICAGNSPVTGEFPTQRPVTRSFDVYFDLRPNERLSKQWWGWWFETLSRSLWRHRNDNKSIRKSDLYALGCLRCYRCNPLTTLVPLRWLRYICTKHSIAVINQIKLTKQKNSHNWCLPQGKISQPATWMVRNHMTWKYIFKFPKKEFSTKTANTDNPVFDGSRYTKHWLWYYTVFHVHEYGKRLSGNSRVFPLVLTWVNFNKSSHD